jgi:hypothetical protein
MLGWTQKSAGLADIGDRRNLHSLTEETGRIQFSRLKRVDDRSDTQDFMHDSMH